ncbi:MAG: carbamoyltransferase C-terminal domain-containing protein [Solirubrobacterales bacterium]
MLILGYKPGHDGAVAAVQDRVLLHSLEGEKDSGRRHASLSMTTLLAMEERLGAVPDVIALGGWHRDARLGDTRLGVGYSGLRRIEQRPIKFFGKEVTLYASSHERSHLVMSVGMAPRDEFTERVVLTWEGTVGSFYVLDDRCKVKRRVKALNFPGWRYAFVYSLADPTYPDGGIMPRHSDSGKLMALAAFAQPDDADRDVVALVDDVLQRPIARTAKGDLRDSPLYNIGVEAQPTKIAAALITERIFNRFADVAREQLPETEGLPLHISGGCGLNCDWNRMWRDLGFYSSVFVPPCTNDSGSALGTAMDALGVMTGDPYIDWNVYSGLEFEWDQEPDPSVWQSRELRMGEVAEALATGRVFAWVQGRWEIGPRALGNRSLLAEPFAAATRDRLNDIKQREGYRPIAPVCRVEDLAQAFDGDFEDPYMLYFRMVRSPDLKAITHVDGSARCQTVSRSDNEPLHELLSEFGARSGIGVLCNTSLNFKGFGFINRMSDLAKYCEEHGVDDMVVGDRWLSRRGE